MRVLYKSQGDKGFREIVIPNDLHTMQQLVGGPIETVTIATDAVIICNEEGRLTGMASNCKFLGVDFVGPLMIVGVDGEEFTDCPWSVAMANKGVEA